MSIFPTLLPKCTARLSCVSSASRVGHSVILRMAMAAPRLRSNVSPSRHFAIPSMPWRPSGMQAETYGSSASSVISTFFFIGSSWDMCPDPPQAWQNSNSSTLLTG